MDLRSWKLALVFALMTPATPAVAVETTAAEWRKLLNREVIVESVTNAEGLRGVRARVAIHASRKRIWQALVDYEHYQKVFLGIRKMNVLDQNPSGAIIEYWIDAILTDFNYVVHRHYETPGERITWRRLSGDLERVEGSWEIRDTPHPNVKLLNYESYVEVGRVVPVALVVAGAMERAHNMAVRLRTWIEEGKLEDPPPEAHQALTEDYERHEP